MNEDMILMLSELPLPGMNSNLMSLSSFLGFLNLSTRLMGILDEAAGSCKSTTVIINY